MTKLKKKKKAKKYLFYQLLLSLVIILFLGTIGVGYAAWNNVLTIKGTVFTGYIEPVFSEAQLSVNGAKGQGTVLITGEKLIVNITDARSGDIYFLDFVIKNKGTIPVKAETLVVTSGEALDVLLIQDPINIIEGQGIGDGRIKIKVRQVTEDVDCGFMVQLSFCQYVV